MPWDAEAFRTSLLARERAAQSYIQELPARKRSGGARFDQGVFEEKHGEAFAYGRLGSRGHEVEAPERVVALIDSILADPFPAPRGVVAEDWLRGVTFVMRQVRAEAEREMAGQ